MCVPWQLGWRGPFFSPNPLQTFKFRSLDDDGKPIWDIFKIAKEFFQDLRLMFKDRKNITKKKLTRLEAQRRKRKSRACNLKTTKFDTLFYFLPPENTFKTFGKFLETLCRNLKVELDIDSGWHRWIFYSFQVELYHESLYS